MPALAPHVSAALPAGLYAIVDDATSADPVALARAFVEGGAAVVQLRLKRAGSGALLSTALAVRELCRGRALFLVNDRADVAKLSGADGVHLGQEDLPLAEARALLGPGALIGLSTHGDDELDAALAAGADYVGFGPIFATASKPGAPLPAPHGLEGLRRAVRRAGRVPVVAIGGITAATAGEVAHAGARCAAAIAELCRAPDPRAAAERMSAGFQAGRARGAA